MIEKITEHTTLTACNTFLNENSSNNARFAGTYKDGLNTIFLTKHFE